MTRRQVEAYRNGWAAHARGEEANPYDDRQAYFSSRMWTCGWTDRYTAVKHDLDLSFDNEILEVD